MRYDIIVMLGRARQEQAQAGGDSDDANAKCEAVTSVPRSQVGNTIAGTGCFGSGICRHADEVALVR